ncbi:hypothetical protein N9Y17_01375 [Gammaproteobacteria bacterium]|nr:hypothetical protein [Gammaproteobacteria bacterium]
MLPALGDDAYLGQLKLRFQDLPKFVEILEKLNPREVYDVKKKWSAISKKFNNDSDVELLELTHSLLDYSGNLTLDCINQVGQRLADPIPVTSTQAIQGDHLKDLSSNDQAAFFLYYSKLVKEQKAGQNFPPFNELAALIKLQSWNGSEVNRGEINTRYQYQSPFSPYGFNANELAKKPDQGERLFEKQNNTPQLDTVIKAFEDNQLEITDWQKQYTANYQRPTPTKLHLKDAAATNAAFKLIYQCSDIDTLKVNDMEDLPEDLNWDYQPNLKYVSYGNDKLASFKDNASFKKLCQAAARNRLLKASDEKFIDTIASRKSLWKTAGEQTLKQFQGAWGDFELDSVGHEDWVKKIQAQMPQNVSESELEFYNFTQQGTKGVEHLFQAITDNQSFKKNNGKPIGALSPQLQLSFNLNGDLASSDPAAYIEQITKSLKSTFDEVARAKDGSVIQNGRFACPIVKQWHLVLPQGDQLTNSLEAIKVLLTHINTCKTSQLDEAQMICFYGLDANNSKDFLAKLKELVDDNSKWLVPFTFPQWDKLPSENLDENHKQHLKTYRDLQNKAQQNLKTEKAELLKTQTQPLTALVNEGYNQDAAKPKEAVKKEQPHRSNQKYIISNDLPAVQFQQQQQMNQQAQQQNQQQNQEQQLDQELEEGVGAFEKGGRLITRQNINSEEVKNLFTKEEQTKVTSGLTKGFFNQFVGTQINAAKTIVEITPAAFKALMQYQHEFQIGISQENLPPGFKKFNSTTDGLNHGYVLDFDPQEQAIDAYDHPEKLQEGKRKYAFKVLNQSPSHPESFIGDYEQFGKDDQALARFFYHLKSNAEKTISSIKGMQEVRGDTTSQLDQKQLDVVTALLKGKLVKQDFTLTIKNTDDKKQEFIKHFITLFKGNTSLLALGQVFNQYDGAVAGTGGGIHQFCQLAYAMYSTFGKGHFDTWWKNVVAPSNNLSELLTQSSIEQHVQSMHFFSGDNSDLTNIWFALIKAHGTGTKMDGKCVPVYYDHLWQGFCGLNETLKKVDLNLTNSLMSQYLESIDGDKKFNGQVFLDRLDSVLRAIPNQEGRQKVLDNINQINWGHDGLYYAVKLLDQKTSFQCWHSELKFDGFKEGEDVTRPYNPAWTYNDKGSTDPVTDALRYLALTRQLGYEDVEKLTKVFQACDKFSEDKKYLVTRLLLASMVRGGQFSSEKPDELNNIIESLAQNDINCLKELNKQIAIEAGGFDKPLRLKFEDMPDAIDLLKDTKWTCDKFDSINQIGQALSCYKRKYGQLTLQQNQGQIQVQAQKITFEKAQNGKFDQFNGKTSFVKDKEQCLFYPWLVNQQDIGDVPYFKQLQGLDDNKQAACEQFFKQLQSIDYAQTAHLPTHTALKTCYEQIKSSNKPHDTRREIVAELIKQGCSITDQDAPYRLVNETSDGLDQILRDTFSGVYRDQNIDAASDFIKHYVAVKTEGQDAKQELTDLIKQIALVETQTPYNDIGQLTGALHQACSSNNGKGKYITAECLTAVIKEFQPKEGGLFPVDLVGTLFSYCHDSSFRSSALNTISDKPGEMITGAIQLFAGAKSLPSSASQQLLKAYLTTNDENQKTCIKQQVTELSKFAKPADQENGQDGEDKLNQKAKVLKEQRQLQVDRYCDWAVGGDLYKNEDNKDFIENFSKYLFDQNIHSSAEFNERHAWLQALTNKKLVKKPGENPSQKTHVDCKVNLTAIFTDYNNQGKKDIPTILMAALQAGEKIKDRQLNTDTAKQLNTLKEFLAQRNDLNKITEFLKTDSGPSLNQWQRLQDKVSQQNQQPLMTTFEKDIRTTKENDGKIRTFDTDKANQGDIKRVLQSFKIKGKGAIEAKHQTQLITAFNTCHVYHQSLNLETVNLEDLKTKLTKLSQDLKIDAGNPNEGGDHLNKKEIQLQILTVMREILLRKTGKWVNRTQMLDLIYAGQIHDETGLLHELKTGEGKSIITVMRAGYLALTGQNVDIFSAKESLADRDYQEWKGVLEAFGVPCGQITATSEENDYKLGGNIGAVHYTTPGHFSLWHSKMVEQGKLPKSFSSTHGIDKGVAWFDESDHIMLDETTMYNYAVQLNVDENEKNKQHPVHKDAWLFEVVYNFYTEQKKQELPQNNQDGKLVISTEQIKQLCGNIDKVKPTAEDSPFIKKFYDPCAVNPQEGNQNQASEFEEKRNRELVGLINAAAAATNLKEGTHFSPTSAAKDLYGSQTKFQFATVMIDNQLMPGSTYSDGIQQMLHTRLNLEARKEGKQPNYIIEPESVVSQSQLVSNLKRHFKRIEGCTGTTGNPGQQDDKSVLDIRSVIKLPTNFPTKVEYLPMQFAQDSNDQVIKIAQQIKEKSANQPILVICEDDAAVEAMHQAVKAKLTNQNITCYADTNAKGISENDVVPHCGDKNWVTFTSRMGRGTDIKPEVDQGLLVIRTHVADSRTRKQEMGRTARNGGQGQILEILAYDAIQKDVNHFKGQEQNQEQGASDPWKELYKKIYQDETDHLNEKIERAKGRKEGEKHPKDEFHIGPENNSGNKEKYLQVRAIAQLKRLQAQDARRYQDGKDQLLAWMTTQYENRLLELKDNQEKKSQLKTKWIEGPNSMRAQVDRYWLERMKSNQGQNNQDHDTYKAFYDNVEKAWETFAGKHSLTDKFTEIQDAQQKLQTASNPNDLYKTLGSSKAVEKPEEGKDYLKKLIALASKYLDGLANYKEKAWSEDEATDKIKFLKFIKEKSAGFCDGSDNQQRYEAFLDLVSKQEFYSLSFEVVKAIWDQWPLKVIEKNSADQNKNERMDQYPVQLEWFKPCMNKLVSLGVTGQDQVKAWKDVMVMNQELPNDQGEFSLVQGRLTHLNTALGQKNIKELKIKAMDNQVDKEATKDKLYKYIQYVNYGLLFDKDGVHPLSGNLQVFKTTLKGVLTTNLCYTTVEDNRAAVDQLQLLQNNKVFEHPIKKLQGNDGDEILKSSKDKLNTAKYLGDDFKNKLARFEKFAELAKNQDYSQVPSVVKKALEKAFKLEETEHPIDQLRTDLEAVFKVHQQYKDEESLRDLKGKLTNPGKKDQANFTQEEIECLKWANAGFVFDDQGNQNPLATELSGYKEKLKSALKETLSYENVPEVRQAHDQFTDILKAELLGCCPVDVLKNNLKENLILQEKGLDELKKSYVDNENFNQKLERFEAFRKVADGYNDNDVPQKVKKALEKAFDLEGTEHKVDQLEADLKAVLEVHKKANQNFLTTLKEKLTDPGNTDQAEFTKEEITCLQWANANLLFDENGEENPLKEPLEGYQAALKKALDPEGGLSYENVAKVLKAQQQLTQIKGELPGRCPVAALANDQELILQEDDPGNLKNDYDSEEFKAKLLRFEKFAEVAKKYDDENVSKAVKQALQTAFKLDVAYKGDLDADLKSAFDANKYFAEQKYNAQIFEGLQTKQSWNDDDVKLIKAAAQGRLFKQDGSGAAKELQATLAKKSKTPSGNPGLKPWICFVLAAICIPVALFEHMGYANLIPCDPMAWMCGFLALSLVLVIVGAVIYFVEQKTANAKALGMQKLFKQFPEDLSNSNDYQSSQIHNSLQNNQGIQSDNSQNLFQNQ